MPMRPREVCFLILIYRKARHFLIALVRREKDFQCPWIFLTAIFNAHITFLNTHGSVATLFSIKAHSIPVAGIFDPHKIR